MEALNTTVEAVQHRRQVELALPAGDLRDVREELFIGLLSGKVTIDEVLILFCQPVGFGEAVGAAPGLDDQVVLPTNAIDPPATSGVAPVQPEPGDDPPDIVK